MTTATWATLADGTRVGWNGLGGAPYYAPNAATGALRLPDLRGMYAEAAGFDALGVGGAHGDGIRNITGSVTNCKQNNGYAPSGMFYEISQGGGGGYYGGGIVGCNAARIVPTAPKNQPRAWGVLACVYLGKPAS